MQKFIMSIRSSNVTKDPLKTVGGVDYTNFFTRKSDEWIDRQTDGQWQIFIPPYCRHGGIIMLHVHEIRTEIKFSFLYNKCQNCYFHAVCVDFCYSMFSTVSGQNTPRT